MYALYLLIVVMPLTVFVPLGPPLVLGVHPMFVRWGVELSDVMVLGVVLAAWRSGSAPSLPLRIQLFPWLLLSIVLLAVAFAPLALVPSLAGYSAGRWLLAVALCWALPRMELAPERVAAVFTLTLGIQVLIGIGQIMQQGPIGLPGELALTQGQLGASVVVGENIRWLRPYGLTFHPNVLAGFLAVGLLLGLPLLGRLSIRLLWWLEWLGLLLTFSRTAWLAIVLSMPVAVCWLYVADPALRAALRRALLGALAIAVIAGWAMSEQLSARIGPLVGFVEPGPVVSEPPAERALAPSPLLPSTSEPSVFDRAEMVRLALRVIAAHPLTGVGAGGFPLVMLSLRSSAPPQYVHNVPLLLAAEVGCGGGLAWLGLWGAGFWVLFKSRRARSPWMVVALCAWLALALIALLDSYPWALGSGRLLTTTVLGLVTALGRLPPSDSLPRLAAKPV